MFLDCKKELKMRILSLFVVAMCVPLSASAESGYVESVSAGTYQITTNDFGDSRYTVITTKVAGITVKSDVSFMKVGGTSISECAASSIADSKGSKVEGTCLTTDSDGDKYKIILSRTNVIGGNNPGTQSWFGLTGKYVGMTGTCTYENRSQVLNGVIYGMNISKCNLTR